MRTIYLITVLLALVGVRTGFSAPPDFVAPVTPVTPMEEKSGGTPEHQLRPIPTGVIYMMSKRGFEVISPVAPAALGKGETVLTQDIRPEPVSRSEAGDKKDFGGIRLFGVAF